MADENVELIIWDVWGNKEKKIAYLIIEIGTKLKFCEREIVFLNKEKE